MALFNDYITTKGKRMLAGMLAGEVENLEFTRVVLGDGENRNPEGATEVISPICDAVIESVVLNDNNVLSITASFTNESIETGFYMKEKGIYISDGKEEVLAIYANAGSTASYIEPAASGLIKKVIRSSITFSQADIINVTLKDSGYANEVDFENHVENKENPHKVTAEQVGLGNVPNVATNDQEVTYNISEQTNVEQLSSGESLRVALRKLAKAVADYISHKADQVVHITVEERTAWNAKLGTEKIAANLTTDTDGMVLAAAMGKNLQEQISILNSNYITASCEADVTTEETFVKTVYTATELCEVSVSAAHRWGYTQPASIKLLHKQSDGATGIGATSIYNDTNVGNVISASGIFIMQPGNRIDLYVKGNGSGRNGVDVRLVIRKL